MVSVPMPCCLRVLALPWEFGVVLQRRRKASSRRPEGVVRVCVRACRVSIKRRRAATSGCPRGTACPCTRPAWRTSWQ